MEYLALYRKYRPKNLDEVVGQDEIKKILASSVKNKTITHAYLFSGPRGTGKTTMAKILAKMVNCESPVDGNPCDKCACCINISNSSDIIEIDAASNNGVDEIRDLREKATLVPSSLKYKVYIIDEVHMLTTQAFNALLKTLEEPPKHVIFILATTEYYKIPLTIASRCQKFQFTKITLENIVSRLRKIADLENINITDEALFEIAKISDGGMRDSINFLDQIRSFNMNEISISDVYMVCGSVSFNDIFEFLINLKNEKIADVLDFFSKINAMGINYNKFLEDVVVVLKDAILYKKNVDNKYIKCDIDKISELANLYTLSDIFYLIQSINCLIDRLKIVSRQATIVSSSFLLSMYEINKTDFADTESEKYEMAFNLGENEVKKVKEIEVNVTKKEKTVDKENIYEKNIDTIINNSFAVADKEIKNKLQELFNTKSDYLTDKKFSTVAGIFIDTNIEVAGNYYIIFTGKNEGIVEKIYDNYELCNEFLKKIFDGEYTFCVVTSNKWQEKRDEYIKNIKAGKVYKLIEIEKNKPVVETKKKKSTVVDKLFDLVGEENVEFK